jgi:acyl carrier protein
MPRDAESTTEISETVNTSSTHAGGAYDQTLVAAVVKDFIVNNLVRDPSAVLALHTPLRDAGLLDSMSLLELLAFIETTFDLRLPDYFGSSTDCVSVASIALYVCRATSSL